MPGSVGSGRPAALGCNLAPEVSTTTQESTATIHPREHREFWLLNTTTREVYPLGPMYGGTVEYARQKLEAERLPYSWRLLATVAERG